jgi:hypothetical protein
MAAKAVAQTNVGEGGSSGPGRGVDPDPSQWGVGAEKGGEEDREGKQLQSMILMHFPLSEWLKGAS